MKSARADLKNNVRNAAGAAQSFELSSARITLLNLELVHTFASPDARQSCVTRICSAKVAGLRDRARRERLAIEFVEIALESRAHRLLDQPPVLTNPK
eukprot:3888563-Pleurochrysis_carterae.AAC.1